MDAVHIHLFLNHFPILGSVFATALLAYSLVRKSDELMRLAFFVLALSAAVAIPVFLTGEPAGETVEKIAGVGESFIEAHEESAKFALWSMIIAGAASVIAFFLSVTGKGLARVAAWFVLLLGIASAGLMLRTGNLGGQIRHSEIRAGSADVQQTESKGSRRGRGREDDDR